MVPDAYVNHVRVLTGDLAREQLREFYSTEISRLGRLAIVIALRWSVAGCDEPWDTSRGLAGAAQPPIIASVRASCNPAIHRRI